MARDKLITIRIEGETRDAFNQLAKSQNTDTASLLYDFISGCLDGTLDIKLVTGKGNRLDNQIDTNRIDNRLDKLETTTQKIDERLGIITKKLNDWIEAFDDRLNDCDQGLSEKIFSLEHRLNALAIRLDSQKDSQQDSQQDSQEIDRIDNRIDMEHLLKREREASIASPIPTIDGGNGDTPDLPPSPVGPVATAIASIDGTVEDAVEPDSTIETVASAIENENRETSPPDEPGEGDTREVSPSPPSPALEAIESLSTVETGEGMNAAQAYRYLAQKEVKVSEKTLSNWVNRKGIPMTDKGDQVLAHLILRDGRYFPDQG